MVAALTSTMTVPAVASAASPSVSRATTVSTTVTGMTANPKTWSLVIGRSATTPTLISSMTLRQNVLVPDADSSIVRKTGSIWRVDITHDFGALTGASPADLFWVCLVSTDPTVTTNALDLVSGPFTVIA